MAVETADGWHMPAGMAGQRDHGYPLGQAPQTSDRREPEPACVIDIRVVVDGPVRLVRQLRRAIPEPVSKADAPRR